MAECYIAFFIFQDILYVIFLQNILFFLKVVTYEIAKEGVQNVAGLHHFPVLAYCNKKVNNHTL